jgi:hypothetical protein
LARTGSGLGCVIVTSWTYDAMPTHCLDLSVMLIQ